MLFVRIAIAILSSVLILFATVGAIGLIATADSRAAAAGGLGVMLFIACCGLTGVLAVPVYRLGEKSRRMSVALNSIYLGIGVLVFLVASVGFIGGDAAERTKNASSVLGGAAICIYLTILVALLVKLGDAVRESPRRSIPARVVLALTLAFMSTMGAWSGAIVIPDALKQLGESRTVGGPRPESVEKIPEFNYSVRSPGGKWVRAPKGAYVKDASLVLVNAAEKFRFCVISEHLGPDSEVDIDSLVNVVKSNAESVADEISFEAMKDVAVGGISGKQFQARVRIREERSLEVFWVGISADTSYQLVTWGPQSSDVALLAAATNFQSRFSLINPPVAPTRPEKFEASAFGLTIDLKDSGWRRWKKGGDPASTSEFGASNSGRDFMQIAPVSIAGLSASDDVITNALLGLFSFRFPGDGVSKIYDSSADGVRTLKFAAERDVSGVGRCAYRMRILRRGDIACLAVAWQSAGVKDRDALESVLDRVSLSEITAKPDASIAPLRHALFLNLIGINCFDRENFEEALDLFQSAFKLSPNDASIAANIAKTFGNLDRNGDAADFVGSVLDRFRSSKSLVGIRAESLAKSGRHSEAAESYIRLLSLDAANPQAVSGLVRELVAAGQPERAESELRARQGESADRVLLAAIRRAQGKEDEAIALLRAGIDADPVDTRAGEELIEICSASDRHSEVIEASQALEKVGYKTSYTLFERAKAELALDRLVAAKSSLEAAIKIHPGEKVVQDMLRDVETRLGQADSSLFGEAIEPVELPSVVNSELPAAESRTGAAYSLRAACWRFVPGKDLRQTSYFTFRITDRRGVDAMSSFAFEFDPTYERMYVNRLEVCDAAGKVEFTGTTAGYYTSTDSDSSHASQQVTLHVPIGALAPGRTVRLVITRRDLDPPSTLPFRRFFFRGGAPAAITALTIDADPSLLRVVPSGDLKKLDWEKGPVFIAENQPAWKHESLAPPNDRHVPHADFGAAAGDWKAIAIEYRRRIEARFEPDPGVAELASRLSGDAGDDETRLRRIAAYVQQELSYRAIEFGPRAQVPTPVAEIVANRFGDCKDHALLFMHLARAAGIRCMLALASTEGAVIPELPSLSQFNHVINYLPDSGRYVDLTDKETDPLSSPPYGLNGGDVLVLDPENPGLMRVPDFSADASVLDSDREVTIEGRGLIVHETMVLSGFVGAWLRESVVSAGNDKLVEALNGYYSNVGAQLIEARSENPEDTSRPLRLSVTYKIPGAVGEAGGQAALTLPYIFERRWFALDPTDSRQDPLYIAFSRVFRSRIRVHSDRFSPPEHLETLNFDKSDPALSVSRQVSLVDGAIEIRAELRMIQGQYLPAEYAHAAEMSSEAIAKLEHDVVLVSKPQSN